MNVLVVDVGGTHVKILATGQKDGRELSSGPKLTATKRVAKAEQLAADWQYEGVTVGDNADAFIGGFRLWETAPRCATTEITA